MNLDRKITFRILIVGSIVTCITIVTQLTLDYLNGRKQIHQSTADFLSVQLGPLGQALWEFNDEMLHLIMEALVSNEHVAAVSIAAQSGETYRLGEAHKDLSAIKRQITYASSTKDHIVGNISVVITESNLISEIRDRGIIVIVSQVLRTLVMVVAILWIIQSTVIQRLRRISDKFSYEIKSTGDEIDQLKTALSHYSKLLIEQIKKRNQLEAEGKMKMVKMAAGMAHEVNTPLQSVSFGLHTLKMGSEGEAQTKLIDACSYSTEKIGSIIKLIRLIADSEIYSRANQSFTDIEEHFEVCLESWRKTYGKLELYCSVIDTLVNIPKRFIDYVMNELIKNAFEANQNSHDEICLELEEGESGWLEILVKNKGKAIPADIVEEMFLPFTTSKRKTHAYGLGLSISKYIVENFGGSVDYYYESGWNVFRVCLKKKAFPRGEDMVELDYLVS